MKLQCISFYISESQSKQSQFVVTYLVLPEVRDWGSAEAEWSVVLGFAWGAWVGGKTMGLLFLSFNFLILHLLTLARPL